MSDKSQSSTGKKGNPRWRSGRKRRQCERYRREMRREVNRTRRLVRHLKRQPTDHGARRALERFTGESIAAYRLAREAGAL